MDLMLLSSSGHPGPARNLLCLETFHWCDLVIPDGRLISQYSIALSLVWLQHSRAFVNLQFPKVPIINIKYASHKLREIIYWTSRQFVAISSSTKRIWFSILIAFLILSQRAVAMKSAVFDTLQQFLVVDVT